MSIHGRSQCSHSVHESLHFRIKGILRNSRMFSEQHFTVLVERKRNTSESSQMYSAEQRVNLCMSMGKVKKKFLFLFPDSSNRSFSLTCFLGSGDSSRVSAHCEMNGLFYTSIYRNESGSFHVQRGGGCWRMAMNLGYIAVSLRCSTSEDSEWPACFTRCFFFTALFPNDTSFVYLIFCFCFKEVHSCVVKSDR